MTTIEHGNGVMHNLTDLHKRMLSAIRHEASGIEVSRVGDDMVMVRTGEQRWYGKQAVAAVVNLMVQGLLTRVAGRYELTESGARVARTLPGPEGAKRQAPRPTTCSRCNRPLQPRQLRCQACGARVPTFGTGPSGPTPSRERSAGD